MNKPIYILSNPKIHLFKRIFYFILINFFVVYLGIKLINLTRVYIEDDGSYYLFMAFLFSGYIRKMYIDGSKYTHICYELNLESKMLHITKINKEVPPKNEEKS